MSIHWTAALLFLGLAVSAMADPVGVSYPSPDGALRAVVVPTGQDTAGTKMEEPSEKALTLEYECRVEIYNREGRKLWSEDFGSADHDHGRCVAFALWSPDSSHFVFSTVSSSGHHPWEYFTYAYSRKQNDLHILDRFIGEVIDPKFSMAAPDRISLQIFDRSVKDSKEDWPAKTVKVSLSELLADKKPPPGSMRVNPPIYSPY